ncbi:MAG: oligosaccharide flippase family protein, partial [Chloroflexales bacterium]|nr:oligosaccharide flippase family protein [Chloroflexales bacterium]
MANASGESEDPPRASAAAVPLPSAPDKPLTTQGLVLRNAMLLMVAQAIATPLAILANAVLARFLGPIDFGYIYLAGTFLAFGFLAVEWGQAGMLPALISRDRGSASVVLGTALSWRLGMAPIAYLIITATCWALGYGGDLQIVLALAFMGAVVMTLNGACQDAVRGFERTDVAATTQVMSSLLGVVVLVPVLLLGGGVRSVLAAQAACALVILCVLWRALRSIGVNKLSFQRKTLKVLLVGGTPFLAFSVAMVLQPSIDAAFLSRQASPEAVGWYAAARKLIGPLAMPASALITALYPTLTRLFAEDRQAFNRTTRDAVRTSTILAMPLALGCLLYPDLGVRIFSRDSYGPAADNLRILSVFILLLYFSMPLGACLAAAGRSKAWAAAQG